MLKLEYIRNTECSLIKCTIYTYCVCTILYYIGRLKSIVYMTNYFIVSKRSFYVIYIEIKFRNYLYIYKVGYLHNIIILCRL